MGFEKMNYDELIEQYKDWALYTAKKIELLTGTTDYVGYVVARCGGNLFQGHDNQSKNQGIDWGSVMSLEDKLPQDLPRRRELLRRGRKLKGQFALWNWVEQEFPLLIEGMGRDSRNCLCGPRKEYYRKMPEIDSGVKNPVAYYTEQLKIFRRLFKNEFISLLKIKFDFEYDVFMVVQNCNV